MLEGNEVEGQIGDSGKYALDVDEKGNVKVSVNFAKDLGYAKAKSDSSIETNVFLIAEQIAKKTETTVDDKFIASLKALLGIVDVVESAPAEPPPAS